MGGREDLPLLFHICKEQTKEEFCLWGADFFYDYPPRLEQMRQSFDSRSCTVFYVAEWNERGIGVAEITEINDKIRSGVLARIVLEPKYRGKGVGKQFVRCILERVPEDLGLQEVSLVVYACNRPARMCYEACGFQYEEELIRPGRPDALQMKISLEEASDEIDP